MEPTESCWGLWLPVIANPKGAFAGGISRTGPVGMVPTDTPQTGQVGKRVSCRLGSMQAEVLRAWIVSSQTVFSRLWCFNNSSSSRFRPSSNEALQSTIPSLKQWAKYGHTCELFTLFWHQYPAHFYLEKKKKQSSNKMKRSHVRRAIKFVIKERTDKSPRFQRT